MRHGPPTFRQGDANESTDWRDFALEEECSVEADSRTEAGSSSGFPPTETRAFNTGNASPTSPAAEIAIEQGLCTTAATSIRARQTGSAALRASSGAGCSTSKRNRDFQLPNGGSAEQCGDRQNDLILVWSEEQGGMPRRGSNQVTMAQGRANPKAGTKPFPGRWTRVASRRTRDRSAQSRHRRQASPRAHAEAILAAARRTGDRDKEATALTDLGVIQLNEGDAQGAIASLEKALAITREIGDTARESDVVGNLGMAMLAVRQPERARALFEQELAHARADRRSVRRKGRSRTPGNRLVEPARLQRRPRVF